MPSSSRRVPWLALPAHPWRPGRTPRPREPVLDADPETVVWHGADLFDHGAWWEAHAIWEEIWRVQPRESLERDALQALIQAAAYQLKTSPRNRKAGERLRSRALARLDRCIDGGLASLFTLDLVRFRSDLAAHMPGAAPLTLHGVDRPDTRPPEAP